MSKLAETEEMAMMWLMAVVIIMAV